MRLDRYAEHFRQQFNWPPAILQLPVIAKQPQRIIDISPQTLSEVEKAITNLKQHRTSDSNGLSPEISRDGSLVWQSD